MVTFLIGMAILLVGGLLYGKFCEKIMKPDDRITPAYLKEDGVDFVPMKTWKNSLINLLNIAGTGPILGPIQGILFGPIAFLLIPIGCVLGGAMHDYFSGMISLRNGGAQMPELIKKYTNKGIYSFYNIFICLLLLLVGAVFIYTPGDIAATQIFGLSGEAGDITTWVIYGVIFLYYILAVLFPIDKIIGKIYPVFGAILLISAVGVFVGLFTKGYELTNFSIGGFTGIHPVDGSNIVPVFFVTVACGIVSGFHSTQTTLIGRSVTSEKQGRTTFFNMMILEGFIAMIWAAAAMGAFAKGIADYGTSATAVVGIVAKDMLGNIGGTIAILGVVVLPITSGDTSLRGLRLVIADVFKIDQKPMKNRLAISGVLFAIVLAILIWAKFSPDGFTVLWRYFAWSNQTISIFAFAIIAIYLLGKGHKIAFLMSLIPGGWYTFIISSYILSAKIGFGLATGTSYLIAGGLTLLYLIAVCYKGNKRLSAKLPVEEAAVYKKAI